MKKIILLLIGLISLLITYSSNISYNVIAESYDVIIPESLNIINKETSFSIKLNKHLDDNQRIQIVTTGSCYLTCDDNEKIKVDIHFSNDYLSNDNPEIVVSISHDELPKGNWTGELCLDLRENKKHTDGSTNTSKVEKSNTISKEEKIMYSYQTVTSFDEENYLLEKPNGDYEERIQYSSISAVFQDSTFDVAMPEDGFYQELIQYGYKERTKEEIKTPKQILSNRYYNNIGACPIECISGTENFYGSGCECTIKVKETVYDKSYAYGEWQLNEDSWRNNEAYTETDTLLPIERTVYLLPVGWSEPSSWSYADPGNTQTTKSISRIVYVVPASYSSSSEFMDSKPSGDHLKITKQKFCRIITNGDAGEWFKCD